MQGIGAELSFAGVLTGKRFIKDKGGEPAVLVLEISFFGYKVEVVASRFDLDDPDRWGAYLDLANDLELSSMYRGTAKLRLNYKNMLTHELVSIEPLDPSSVIGQASGQAKSDKPKAGASS